MSDEIKKIQGKFISGEDMATLANAYRMIEGITVSGLNNVRLMGMVMESVQTVFEHLNEREIMEIDAPMPPPAEEKTIETDKRED